MKRKMFSLALALGVLLPATTQAAEVALDEKTGVKIGEKAPSFALKDQLGKKGSSKIS